MAEKKRLSEAYAETFTDVLPKIWDTDVRIESDYAQFMTWLVGIASTLLAVGAANVDQVQERLSSVYGCIVAFLVLTIVFGVIYRVFALWLAGKSKYLLDQQYGFFLGYLATRKSFQPVPLQDYWDEEEILERLDELFPERAKRLREYNAPIEDCRDVYKREYAREQEDEKSRMDVIYRRLRAHQGRKYIRDSNGDRDNVEESEQIRLSVIRLKRLDKANRTAFSLSSVFFVIAMLFLGVGLL